MTPRFGQPPREGVRYTSRPGAYAILPRKREVMLTVQLDLEWELQLPGGGIDPGEQILAALHREVLEETGWRIARSRRIGLFQRYVFMPEYDLWARKMCTIYLAHPVVQIADPIEPDHRTFWVPITEAVEAIGNDGDRHFLSAYAAGSLP